MVLGNMKQTSIEMQCTASAAECRSRKGDPSHAGDEPPRQRKELGKVDENELSTTLAVGNSSFQSKVGPILHPQTSRETVQGTNFRGEPSIVLRRTFKLRILKQIE